MLMSTAAARFDHDVAAESGDYFAANQHSVGDSDFCSRNGAQILKARIEAYWRERGHTVTVALHNVGFHPAIRAARFDVRSDMVNGMPRSVGPGERAPAPDAFVEDLDLSNDDLAFE
jgi:hypothetical protein